MVGQRHNGYEISHTFLQWQRRGNQRIGVDERICMLRIKTRFPKYNPHKCACSHRRKGGVGKGGLLSESRRDI